MIKTNGATWNQYYNDNAAWPTGAYHDDVIIFVDGVDGVDMDLEKLDPKSKIELHAGTFFRDVDDDVGVSLESHFKKWKKRQTIMCILVEIPIEKEKEFLEALKKEFRGRVL